MYNRIHHVRLYLVGYRQGGVFIMGRMVRKQLYIDTELDQALAARAAATGASQAEIVREAVGRYLSSDPDVTQEAGVRRLQQLWKQSRDAGYGGGDWRSRTREELHERPGDAGRERSRLRGG
jgi:hypothetical protein